MTRLAELVVSRVRNYFVFHRGRQSKSIRIRYKQNHTKNPCKHTFLPKDNNQEYLTPLIQLSAARAYVKPYSPLIPIL